MAFVGMVGYFINNSTEQTNKVSFKAAGLKYREQYTIEKIKNLPDMPVGEKQQKNTYLSKSMRTEFSKNQTIINKNNLVAETKKDENSAKISLTKVKPEPSFLIKNTKSDLQVLSSFDCVKAIPTVLKNYISNKFVNEYGRSHKDFRSEYRVDETLPLLGKINLNCGTDQNCSASFQYDKQYGLSTTANKTYLRDDVFYCCPSVHKLANRTISDICKRARTVVGKSVFRESKNSALLERVIKLIRCFIKGSFNLVFNCK